MNMILINQCWSMNTHSPIGVAWFQLQNVWILTAIQGVNCLLWAVEAFAGWHRQTASLWPYYVMGAHIIFVGMLGGATYANCMFLFNTHPTVPDKYRELGINLG